MALKVDPNKVLQLGQGMKRLDTALENEITGMYRDINGAVGNTRSGYPESYVQSSAASVQSVLSEIKSLAVSIGDKLNDKVIALANAATEYIEAEGRSKNYRTVKTINDWYKRAWDLFEKGVIGLYSWQKGFKFTVNGKYVHVYGSRNASGFWNKAYRNWRTREGLTGTRYRLDNPKVAKYLSPKAMALSELNKNYNILKSGAWKKALKGGGVLGAALTVGGSVYNYGWGEYKNHGLASTEFVSDLAVESTVMIGTTAVSSAAGIAAGAAAGAMFGSVVPGLGTAIGFAVGVGIGVVMSTSWGKSVKDWTKDKVNKGIEFGVKKAKEATEAVGHAASKVIGGLKSLF
ncbi:hypothetical protein MUG84_08685 [Paenibacillus sp. KQZ6P-2]|uniref:LXG domain-containing protein n=1 Tax=Paenibacillus mangrovi TaxID=2931978 RepID=A0A9X1WM57_9BACL|nr:hypothetical protein [Paenibacillus mangrovi]MCJ8011817.1 hypothetical protein [Paenibacillus mangrovi]